MRRSQPLCGLHCHSRAKMRTHDFGGFSTRTCSIDIKFASPEQFEHFLQAWSRPGRPELEIFPTEQRMEMISIGTTLEHELRHYHDFLLSYASLYSYWQRIQAMINAMPVMAHMLRDPEIDYLIFPAMEWAKTNTGNRRKYLADVLGNPDTYARTWKPPVLEGVRPPRTTSDVIRPINDESYQYALFILRDQIAEIENIRGGINSSRFQFSFTPRFVSEISSFLVQTASVQQTYGFEDMDFFLNRLISDGSLYARFFRIMLLLFSGRTIQGKAGSVTLINTREVDWRALGVGVTWCFCGSRAYPDLLKPVDRMARLIQATEEDPASVFPPKLGFADLLDHLDRFFKVEATRDAACRNTEALRGFLHRGATKIVSTGEMGRALRPFIDIFESLLDERDRVVTHILDNPIEYMDVGMYVRALPQWPQCPVSLDFSSAGIVVPKEILGQLGPGAVFSDTYGEDGKLIEDMVVEVSYPSFLPGGSAFPWKTAKNLAGSRDLFDMFFDPQQIGVEREHQIRRSISDEYSKTLIRLLP